MHNLDMNWNNGPHYKMKLSKVCIQRLEKGK